jgi:hypothetical protein
MLGSKKAHKWIKENTRWKIRELKKEPKHRLNKEQKMKNIP